MAFDLHQIICTWDVVTIPVTVFFVVMFETKKKELIATDYSLVPRLLVGMRLAIDMIPFLVVFGVSLFLYSRKWLRQSHN